MNFGETFKWYQQKIGTYDKQKWETRIEQREQHIYGLTHIHMRSAKPNTDLIDLDLVRGSSFTKAKPQHGFVKVAKLATLRCLLLPLYGKWWWQQTSKKFFLFALSLYVTLIVNFGVYYMYSSGNDTYNEDVSYMEVCVPLLMAWLLSLIHSQIVATMPDAKDTRNRTRRGKKLQFKEFPDVLRVGSTSRRFTQPKTQQTGPFHLPFNSYLSRRTYRLNFGARWFKKTTVDDDGFESLNGNGSRTSEEEIVPTETVTSQKTVQIITTTNSTNHNKDSHIEEKDLPIEEPEKIENNIIDNEIPTEQDGSCVRCKKDDIVDVHDDKNCTSCKKCENWVKQIEETVRVTKKVCSTDSESEGETRFTSKYKKTSLTKRRTSSHRLPTIAVTSVLDASTCDTENEALSSPRDWTGVTTNSEDCSTDIDDVSDTAVTPTPTDRASDYMWLDGEGAAGTPSFVKARCTIWERDEVKKADLSMLDISSAIISKVEAIPATPDYFYAGLVVSAVLALLPCLCRLTEDTSDVKQLFSDFKNASEHFMLSSSPLKAMNFVVEELPGKMSQLTDVALGNSQLERVIIGLAMIQRFVLAAVVFFLLAVAEKTFKQRLLYAKLFSHLTSSRRAKKSDIPHFRLNKVRNIKTWLSVRSFLKKRGPQRSVDVIVSSAFVVTLLLLAFLCAEVLKETLCYSQYYLEAIIWCLALGVMLLRFMTLGMKINKKYRNLSVLITEQINLHLQIEQKPHKKDELTVANNVLKLAIDLLKELENPFKISGLSANPILYNITKLVILSALSGVLSELLGFKLKLHKIKIK